MRTPILTKLVGRDWAVLAWAVRRWGGREARTGHWLYKSQTPRRGIRAPGQLTQDTRTQTNKQHSTFSSRSLSVPPHIRIIKTQHWHDPAVGIVFHQMWGVYYCCWQAGPGIRERRERIFPAPGTVLGWKYQTPPLEITDHGAEREISSNNELANIIAIIKQPPRSVRPEEISLFWISNFRV